MNNILNERVRRIVREDLLEYGKYILFFLVLGFVIPFLLSQIFGTRIVVMDFVDGAFNIDLGDFGSVNIDGVFNFVSFGIFSVFMFIAGITGGVELPQNVRWGVARNDYFTATVISAIIVSLIFAPVMLLFNTIINLFVSSGSVFYNFFQIGGGEFPVLVFHFFTYVALFLVGYYIPLVWQRFGWYIWLAFIILLVLLIPISGILGLNIVIGFNVFEVTTTDDYLFLISWDFTDGFSGIFVLLGLIAITVLGVGAYLLAKDVPVKVV